MGYITAKMYSESCKGRRVNDDLKVMVERAAEAIDSVMLNTFEDLSKENALVQKAVQKATAAQVDFIEANGGLAAIDELPTVSVSLGKFSVSAPQNSLTGIGISPRAIAILERAGLLYRGL